MKKSYSALKFAIGVGLLVFSMDQLCKWYFFNHDIMIKANPIGITPNKNYGLFFSFFTGLKLSHKILFTTTIGFFLNVITGIILYFKARYQAKVYLTGLTLTIAGFNSNLLDRLRSGKVFDYLHLKMTYNEYYFSIGDISIALGIICILTGLLYFDRYNLFWQGKIRNKTYVIDRKYQYKLALIQSIFSLFIFSIYFAFNYSFILPVMKSEKIRQVYLTGSTIVFIAMSVLIFSFNIIISNRTAGPLWKFKQWVKSLLKGDSFPYRLRDGDYHKDLESIAKDLSDALDKREATPSPPDLPTIAQEIKKGDKKVA